MGDDGPPRPRRIISATVGPPPKGALAARMELVLAAAQLGSAQLALDIVIARKGLTAAHAGKSQVDVVADQTFTPMDAAMEDLCEAALEYARASGWTPPDASQYSIDTTSELRAALNVIGRECEAFVMFARVGHLDPPRPDGKIPVAILVQRSADPGVDDAIRETARKWTVGEADEVK